jgi:lipid-binding SYLF domain-containing protein
VARTVHSASAALVLVVRDVVGQQGPRGLTSYASCGVSVSGGNARVTAAPLGRICAAIDAGDIRQTEWRFGPQQHTG